MVITRFINLIEWIEYNSDKLIKAGKAIITICLILRFLIIPMVI